MRSTPTPSATWQSGREDKIIEIDASHAVPASQPAEVAEVIALRRGQGDRMSAPGIGHNLPQEAPLDFVHAIEEADSFG